MVKDGRWTLRRFGVQYHRQSVAMRGKVGFPNLLFLSWLLTDDGVEHRNVHLPTFTTGFVLPSIKIVYYQHLLVSFEGLLSLRLSDHFALVVGCINNNWLNVELIPLIDFAAGLLHHRWGSLEKRSDVNSRSCLELYSSARRSCLQR